MLLRPAAGALLAGAAALASVGAGTARAEPAGHGAVVVAIGENVAPAARPLALQLYRDPALRPPGLDDAAARVLVGEPPAEDAAPRLKDLATLRATLGRPSSEPPGDPSTSGGSAPRDPPSTGELVTRRLLTSIGTDAHAALVVAVTLADGRAAARALDVATGAYRGVEIGATVATAADGTIAFSWPGADATLRSLVPAEPRTRPQPAPPPPRKAAPAPVAPKDASDKPRDRSIWSSPWFWVGLGAVVATGVTVFVVTKQTEGGGGTVHLDGRVPR